MRAVVLAGGKGTRLRPYTAILPKPLMPIGTRPILEVVLHQLRHHGVTHVTLAVGYLAELLMAYCGNGEKFGIDVDYSKEDTPLGTAGPLALVNDLNDSFLVMNGDVLTTLDYSRMRARHEASGAMATLAVYPRKVKVDLGVVEFDDESRLTSYIEKPEYPFWVSMGIYYFRPEVLDHIEAGTHLDLPDLVTKLGAAGERVECYEHDGYWLDIGRDDDYERALTDFAELEDDFLPADMDR